jgi:hypothetical protein
MNTIGVPDESFDFFGCPLLRDELWLQYQGIVSRETTPL